MKNISLIVPPAMMILSMIGYILTKNEVSPGDPYLYLISVQIWMATVLIMESRKENKS